MNYFKATEIAKDSYLIEYAFTDQEHVYCYLAIGRDRAIVIDTMYGYGNLKAFCQTLTDKPLQLVNTHFHFDHVAGNFDFDSCYMHHADIRNYNDSRIRTPEEMLETARGEAFPELKDQIVLSDMCAFRHMPVYPLYNGDLLDLGDRKLEVVLVAGHSAGSVAFIDREWRIAYAGDCCNGNTLLGFGNSLPVETYLKNLLHLKHYQDQFDTMYCGHQILPPSVIDEGIELASRVLAGTDDHEEIPGMFGMMTTYAAKHGNSPIERADGKLFNMSYDPQRLFEQPVQQRIIDFQAVKML